MFYQRMLWAVTKVRRCENTRARMYCDSYIYEWRARYSVIHIAMRTERRLSGLCTVYDFVANS